MSLKVQCGFHWIATEIKGKVFIWYIHAGIRQRARSAMKIRSFLSKWFLDVNSWILAFVTSQRRFPPAPLPITHSQRDLLAVVIMWVDAHARVLLPFLRNSSDCNPTPLLWLARYCPSVNSRQGRSKSRPVLVIGLLPIFEYIFWSGRACAWIHFGVDEHLRKIYLSIKIARLWRLYFWPFSATTNSYEI